MKALLAVGARPNFMKIAPLAWEIRRRPDIEATLVHTGQHYSEQMYKVFFEEFDLQRPDVDLGVGSGSHAWQTGQIMQQFEPVLLETRPDVVCVVGDVNSTLACSITATKLGTPVAHVEAGLRSFDRTMPEEINRLLTDSISDLLFVTEPSGMENLRREGVPDERCHLVGNVMIDTLQAMRPRFDQSDVHSRLGLDRGAYAVLTLHRPSNVDEMAVFAQLMQAVARLARELPIVFPVHVRTRSALEGLPEVPNLLLTEPLGYLDFMKLVCDARLVLTDSGGIQEETTVLGVPCLTLRQNTERPITVEQGTNRLVGLEADTIIEAGLEVLRNGPGEHRIPELWDGQTAPRIIDILQGQ